jgi:predicted acylesterase/phospholipase RssA
MTDHFGVVKALLDSNLLPRVIAGTSSGSIIAAFVCTRTDEELKTLLNPSLAKRITACEEPFRIWFRRFLQTGARFNTADWARKASNVWSIVYLTADLGTHRRHSGPEAP